MEQMASILIDRLEERSPAWQRSESKNPQFQGKSGEEHQGKNMKESQMLNIMKDKIVESLKIRVEEGFARELGRGLGGAYRIVKGGIGKTTGAMARAGQEGLESGGWRKAFGGMAKEGLKGLVSGGRKLATGAAKTGIRLLKSFGELNPQDKRGIVAAYRGQQDRSPIAPTSNSTPSAPTPAGPGSSLTPDQIAQKKAEYRQRKLQGTSDRLSQLGAYGDSARSIFSGRGTFTPTSSLRRRTTLDDEPAGSPFADLGIGDGDAPYDPLGFKRGERGSLLGQQAGSVPASRRGEKGRRGDFDIGRFRRKYGHRFSHPDRASTELFGQKIVESLIARINESKKKITETIKVKIEELSIETLQSYAKKASSQVDSGKTPEKKVLKRIKGIGKAETQVARKKMGLDQGKKNKKRNLSTHEGPGSPEGNTAYIARGGNPEDIKPPMSISQINQARSSGNEEAKADANEEWFKKFMNSLSIHGEGGFDGQPKPKKPKKPKKK